MGLSTHATRTDRWAADPEALILFTIEVARRDPRLFDEVLDWMGLNGRLLSLQRLRNLVARFPIDRKLVDAVVAWVGESSPSFRQPSAERHATGRKPKGASLFNQDVLSFVGEPDPVFARFGYLRPLARRSEKSAEPDVHTALNLAFRLRLFFGPGSRSEIMRIVLTFSQGPLDAARIADEVGFTKRNVNEVLTALVDSGALTARWSMNERLFQASRNQWGILLALDVSERPFPDFVSWVHVLPPLVEVLHWLEEEAGSERSEYMASSHARDLADRIAPHIQIVGLTMPAGGSLEGATYLPAFEDLVESLLATVQAR
jgi:hypothetical protein